MMNKKTNELLKLIKENPDLEVIPFVDNDQMADDGGYTVMEWGNACVGEYAEWGDRAYDDREEFKEDYIYANSDWIYRCDDEISDKLVDIKANEIFKKAIIVYIG